MNTNGMASRHRSLGSAAVVLALLLTMFGLPSANAAPRVTDVNIVPTINSISVQNGQLVASGTATAIVKGQITTVPFTAPVNLALAADQSAAGACPILDLTLGPITLDILGLVVETSPICLQINAYENGGLLGDLLCAVANLLNGGLSLDQILGGQGLVDPVTGAVILPGLTSSQISSLLGGLTNLLNAALANLLDAIVTAINNIDTRRVCSILHLELGPLELNLLGLEVILDDCAEGPVVVDITAETGPGNLLGNLLCELLGSGGIGIGSALEDILDGILGLLTN